MSDFENTDLDWLNHVQPVGLVVSRAVLDELGLVPTRQTSADNAFVGDFLNVDKAGPALSDPWGFVHHVLGWDAGNLAGVPGAVTVPAELCRVLPEHHVSLQPTWAIRGARGDNEPPWQALVRIEDFGTNPDKRGELAGWEATPHQRFERLLRETGEPVGVLITDFERDGNKHAEIRLIYAPAGETSGWLAWPLLPLATVAGRPMLGGLKLLLDTHSLFANRRETRLPQILDASRKAQASVSTELSGQVLGALHELLRGLHAAEPKLIEDLAAKEPHHLYEGLLTVLMRLVFILYAEDRDLIPSKTDGRSKTLYDQGYSLRGLYTKLLDDQALYPDTMDERLGGWGRLLALFRLVHKGHASDWIKGRGGKLFDPEVFPFIEGRQKKEDISRVLHVRDGSLLRILRGLMTLKGERLSYRTLDVEQIGSVYETVMGFTVEAAAGRSLAIKAGKSNRVPIFVDLDALAARKPRDRVKVLKEDYSRASVNGNQKHAIEDATSATELEKALENLIDERGSPGGHAAAPGTPILQPTDERRRTGSHYTPRTLTEPIVKHALEPAFERLGDDAKPDDVLALKVCDPAMGSGAFLVEASRQLAARLVKAWARWQDLRPKIPPDEDEDLHARRLVAQRCLYGVDKNPMATDLAKLSLWLATLARDHEFEFVDHALKTGDSLVGLSLAGIAAANWDESKPGLPLFQKLVKDEIRKALATRAEIRDAPDDVHRMIQEVRHQNLEKRLDPIRAMGDATVAAFFAEAKPKARELARQRVESLFTASLHPNWNEIGRIAATLRLGKRPVRPFHWQLEFPEVFEGKLPGFDAIVGNPPFLGGKRISTENGPAYSEWLEVLHCSTSRNADLVAHFFRRAFQLIRKSGVLGLIATNTLSQGDTRASGLTAILSCGGTISRAIRRLRWPGDAAVVVCVVHISKAPCTQPTLDGRHVGRISAYLVEGSFDDSPKALAENRKKSFVGSNVLGIGFTFDDDAALRGAASSIGEMQQLIAANPRNRERIYPYIGWEEISSHPRHENRRYIINFGELPEAEVRREWPELLEIIERRVKPDRMLQGSIVNPARWWMFARPATDLYQAIREQSHVMVTGAAAARHHMIARLPTGLVYSHKTIVFTLPSYAALAALHSRSHEYWSSRFGSTRGAADDLTYNPTDVFATFPFPPGFETDAALEAAGQAYHDHRAALMVRNNEGLTKTYNRFHDPADNRLEIVKLRELHDAMDRAVLTAYGWTDLAERIATDPDAKPRHLTEDTEDDHKYQGRCFWPTSIRDEVLARLIALNAERAEEERKAGLEPVSADEADDETSAGEEEAA